MKPYRWQQGIVGFFKKNLPLIFFVLLVFIAGVVFGALAIRTLDAEARQELVGHLSTFFNGLVGKLSQPFQANPQGTIWLNIKMVAIIWLLGISTVGMPFIPVIIFLRGFVLGFTVGFLVNELGFRGLIFGIVSVLPQNLIIVPAIVVAGMVAISFSLAVVRSLVTKRPMDFGPQLIQYSILMVMVAGVLIFGSLIETFITPLLMKLTAGLVLHS